MPLTIPPSTYANQIFFTPITNIRSTNVQTAITELDSKAVHISGNESIDGVKIFTESTESTSSTTGGTQFRGGIGVSKNASIGGKLLLQSYPSLLARRLTDLSLTSGTLTRLVYPTKDEDTHNAYDSTGVFTAPANCGGKYNTKAYIRVSFAGATSTTTLIIILSVYVNGLFYSEVGRTYITGVSGTVSAGCYGNIDISLSAGSTIDVRVTATYAGSITVLGIANASCSISRIS